MLPTGVFAAVLLALAGSGAATNVHVNRGCILIGGSPACAGKGKGGPVRINNGQTRIHARFSGNKNPFNENSGCYLNARWPQHYGDIYFGADNCLYDSKGQNINGQCCTSGQQRVRNPYNYWYG
ncbi:DUTPase [Fusarium albosuccineum]|uniref:dUTPase n=1 Tax=Fusarium albosuccineum TaxID=1237068 RepID=A0A8H4K8Q3_9HYPO|nr:DUTPase [Fusarium albosuccineum]